MEDKECPCPRCGGHSNRLEILSKLFVNLDYYECRSCCHVFTAPKHKCEPAELVTL